MMTTEQILIGVGALVGALILLRLLFWFVGSVRGRTPAERAARNFAQDRRQKWGASTREARNRLVWRFFRGIIRGLCWLGGGGKKAGKRAATTVFYGQSLNPTKPGKMKRPRSGRLSKTTASGRFHKTI